MLEFLAQNQRYKEKVIFINKKRATAFLADNFLKKIIGLMYKDELPNGTCMLFIFGAPKKYGIWMRNMKFAIDILWLDNKKKIISIKQNAQPARGTALKTYYPDNLALYVVELPAGFVKKNRIALGQVVRFS
jgi:hypothetical protein